MTTLIIPVYNGAPELAALLGSLEAYAATRTSPFEALVVDDGSTDDTSALLRAKNRPWLRVITLPQNRGKGGAIAAGVHAARGDKIIFTDADLPYDLGVITDVEAALGHSDVVIGSRAHNGSRSEIALSVKRRLASGVFSFAANRVLLYRIKDTQCGIKGFTTSAAKALFNDLQMPRFCFDVEILLKAQQKGYAITEVPVLWKNNGASSVSLARDSTRMLRDLLALYVRSRFDAVMAAGIGFLLALLSLPILYNVGILGQLATYPASLFTLALAAWVVCTPALTLLFFNILHLSPLPQELRHEGARYILVGIYNTTLNASVFNLLIMATGIARGREIFIFSLIAYGVTIVQAFWWNKHWVFSAHKRPTTAKTYALFLLITVGVAVVASGCTYLLVSVVGAPAAIPPRLWANIAVALVVPVSFIGNFLGNKLLVFKKVTGELR